MTAATANWLDALDELDQRDLSVCMGGPSETPYDRLHLKLAEDGRLRCVSRRYYGGDGSPMEGWNGRTMVWTIRPNADLAALREDLAPGGVIAGLLDRIAAGHSVEWDDSKHVGRLSEDAREANEELDAYLADMPTYDGEVWTLEGYWGSNGDSEMLRNCDLTTESTNEEVYAAGRRLVAESEGEAILTFDAVDLAHSLIRARNREIEREAL